MRNRNYYRVRSGVRAVFWTGVAIASLALFQLVILCAWSLQF